MSDFIFLRRNSLIALGVVSSHAALILALNSSLRTPARELLIPVSLFSQPAAAAPAIQAALFKGGTPLAPAPVQPAGPKSIASPDPLSPTMPAAADADKAVSSPTPAPAASPPAASKAAAPAASASAGIATPTVSAPNVELPSSDADYLRNPKPIYPALSKRLNEQGTVIHGVLIGTDGRPVSARLVQSSGFDRLDKAAYEAVMQWRYVPGKRQGKPEAMTFNVPVTWALE